MHCVELLPQYGQAILLLLFQSSHQRFININQFHVPSMFCLQRKFIIIDKQALQRTSSHFLFVVICICFALSPKFKTDNMIIHYNQLIKISLRRVRMRNHNTRASRSHKHSSGTNGINADNSRHTPIFCPLLNLLSKFLRCTDLSKSNRICNISSTVFNIHLMVISFLLICKFE